MVYIKKTRRVAPLDGGCCVRADNPYNRVLVDNVALIDYRAATRKERRKCGDWGPGSDGRFYRRVENAPSMNDHAVVKSSLPASDRQPRSRRRIDF